MAKTNVRPRVEPLTTHEGGRAKRINAELQLRRSVLACMLWEKTFYEDGVSIATRIEDTVPEVAPHKVSALAITARHQYNLRHAPLWLVRAMAKTQAHKYLVADTLANVIARADELAEFVSMYWLEGRQPLSAQVKKGLAKAFTKFNAYSLAKYNRDGAVKLRDVLFLCHAKPKDDEQAKVWKQLIDGTLPAPDTWEVNLSAGADKKETWERLINEKKLGALALLRNLRNMYNAKVEDKLVFKALEEMDTSKILPFRFISAARAVPQWEKYIEYAMLKSLREHPKLNGKTVLLIDVSGSMECDLSEKSDIERMDAATGIAIMVREISDDVEVFTFSDATVRVPDRRGFALADAISNSQAHMCTRMGDSIRYIDSLFVNHEEKYDRMIVITDEQAHDLVADPMYGGYCINVAPYKNGVGYEGKWTHIDGFSEAVVDYIIELENLGEGGSTISPSADISPDADIAPL